MITKKKKVNKNRNKNKKAFLYVVSPECAWLLANGYFPECPVHRQPLSRYRPSPCRTNNAPATLPNAQASLTRLRGLRPSMCVSVSVSLSVFMRFAALRRTPISQGHTSILVVVVSTLFLSFQVYLLLFFGSYKL